MSTKVLLLALCLLVLWNLFLCDKLSWTIYNGTLPEGIGGQIVAKSPDGDIYLIGGYNNKYPNVFNNEVWKWNGNTPMYWINVTTTPITPFPEFVGSPQSSISVGYLTYIIGVTDDVRASGKTYIFDTSKEQFISNKGIPLMEVKTNDGCVTIYEDIIYYIGGDNIPPQSNEQIYRTIQRFNITSLTWKKEIPLLPTNVYGSGCAAFNGYVYSFGGYSAQNGHLVAIDDIYKYDIGSSKVIPDPIGHLSVTRGYMNAITGSNNMVYISGGEDDQRKIVKNVEVFNLETEQLLPSVNDSQLVIGVLSAAVTIVNDSIMVFGGEGVKPWSGIDTIQVSTSIDA
eukprot:137419_1